jgi:methyl-accepting chemotaxis protein
VRSLAQRSAEAAKEIKSLIGSSVEKVEAGARLVQDAGTTMTEIVTSVGKVSDIIGEIRASTVEQSEGIGSVNSAVTQLDQMTQQNAALVEQSAAAAESLRDQAGKLSGLVSNFKLQGQPARASLSPAPAAARAPSPLAKAAPARAVAKKPASAGKPLAAKPSRAATAAKSAGAPTASTAPPAPRAAAPAAVADDGDWASF